VKRGEPAALAIIRIAQECAERGDPAPTVVTIGPTTNLALALRLEPSLPDLIGRVVIMGGAYLAQGNWGTKGATSGAAEYNAVTDPEALAIVMNELGSHVQLVTWELIFRSGLDAATVDRWLDPAGSPRSQWLAAVSAHAVRANQEDVGSAEDYAIVGLYIPDPLAIAVALRPSCILQSTR